MTEHVRFDPRQLEDTILCAVDLFLAPAPAVGANNHDVSALPASLVLWVQRIAVVLHAQE